MNSIATAIARSLRELEDALTKEFPSQWAHVSAMTEAAVPAIVDAVFEDVASE